MLNEEFNKFRGLNPVKVFISGPPASGKSHYGQKISEYYNIPHVTVKDAAALMSTMKTRVLLSSMSFIEDSVVNGYLIMACLSKAFLEGVLLLAYLGFRDGLKVLGL